MNEECVKYLNVEPKEREKMKHTHRVHSIRTNISQMYNI